MKKLLPLAFAVAACISIHPAAASVVSELTADQKSQLEAGEMLVSESKVEGGSWPKVTVTTLVKAPVATLTALFHDYEAAPSYQPNMVSATVIKKESPNVVDVRYVSKLPIVGENTNTVRNTYSTSGDMSKVQWTLLESTSANVSDGSMTVEPFDGGSVLRYENYVEPKSKLAVLARSAAVGEVKKTVTEIKDEAEKRAK